MGEPRRVELCGYLYLTLFYAMGITWSVYLLVFERDWIGKSSVIVFCACMPFYVALTILLSVAAFRAYRGRTGTYESVLVSILFPPIIGLLVAPSVVMMHGTVHVTFTLVGVASACVFAVFAYLLVAAQRLRIIL